MVKYMKEKKEKKVAELDLMLFKKRAKKTQLGVLMLYLVLWNEQKVSQTLTDMRC